MAIRAPSELINNVYYDYIKNVNRALSLAPLCWNCEKTFLRLISHFRRTLQCEKMSTLLFLLCLYSVGSANALRVLSTSRQYYMIFDCFYFEHSSFRNLETFEDGSGACLRSNQLLRSPLADFTICLRWGFTNLNFTASL